jgi:hypothetical protein
MHMSKKYLRFLFFHSNNLRLEIKTSWIDKSLVRYENHSVLIIWTARTCLRNWCMKWFIWRAFYSNFLGYEDLFMKKVDKAIYEIIQFWFLDHCLSLKSVQIVVYEAHLVLSFGSTKIFLWSWRTVKSMQCSFKNGVLCLFVHIKDITK